MVRLAVPSPDSPPHSNHSSSNNISAPATNSNYVPVADLSTADATVQSRSPQATPPPAMQHSPQHISQQAPLMQAPMHHGVSHPGSQMMPHHMQPSHHHMHHQHHNGLYMGPAYQNEFYPGGPDQHAYFLPPEMCPAHTQICTVHPEFGKLHFVSNKKNSRSLKYISNENILY